MSPHVESTPVFDHVLDEAAPPTVLLTDEGVLLAYNGAAYDFFGPDLNAHRGRDISAWLATDAAGLVGKLAEIAENRDEIAIELDILRAGARSRHAGFARHMPQNHDLPLITLSWDRRNRAIDEFTDREGLTTEIGMVLASLDEGRLRRELEITVDQLASTSHQLVKREREIRESEERYELAVGEVGIWDWNIVERDIYYSPRLAEMLGYEQAEFQDLVADSIKHLVHPDDLGDYMARLMQHLDNPASPYRSEHRFQTKSGDYRWFQARGRSVCDENGEAVRMTGIITDIHRLKQIEQALRRSEAQLKEAQRLGRIGNFSRDLVTDELEWSEEVYAIVGLTPDDDGNLFERFMDAVHPNDIGRLFDTVARAAEKGTSYQFEYRIVRPDGTVRWIASTGQVTLDADGAPARLFGTMQDITFRKEAEQTLQRAKEEAEYANRTKSEFLAHMSHELRTPLNSILGFSEIMRHEILGALQTEYHEYAGIIHNAGNHLLNLINDILDLSKIEAGNLELDEEAVDANLIIEEVIMLLANAARLGGISLTHRRDDQAPVRLWADPRRVRQILVNLVSNAIKFTDEGEVTVHAAVSDGGVSLVVEDTGCGIAEENIPVALDPFRQVRDNAHVSREGTGLGLSLSKLLAEVHGGGLQINSAVGLGTEVVVGFPPERTMEDGAR